MRIRMQGKDGQGKSTLEGLNEIGKNWKQISLIVETRSPVQIRTQLTEVLYQDATKQLTR